MKEGFETVAKVAKEGKTKDASGLNPFSLVTVIVFSHGGTSGGKDNVRI